MKSAAAHGLADAIEAALAGAVVGERDRIVARFVRDGAPVVDAALYADWWLQYRDASAAVGVGGVAGRAAVKSRDAARAGMARLPWIRADWLWSGGVDAPEDEGHGAEQDPAEDEGEPWPE